MKASLQGRCNVSKRSNNHVLCVFNGCKATVASVMSHSNKTFFFLLCRFLLACCDLAAISCSEVSEPRLECKPDPDPTIYFYLSLISEIFNLCSVLQMDHRGFNTPEPDAWRLHDEPREDRKRLSRVSIASFFISIYSSWFPHTSSHCCLCEDFHWDKAWPGVVPSPSRPPQPDADPNPLPASIIK